MGYAWAVGEDAAGEQGDRFVAQGERAGAASDEFNAIEGEVVAIDGVNVVDVFAAAADHGQAFCGIAVGVEIEAIGFVHLLGEVGGHSSGISNLLGHCKSQ